MGKAIQDIVTPQKDERYGEGGDKLCSSPGTVQWQGSFLYDFCFKLVVIGDCGVGKTSLVQRFARGTFSDKYFCTIGVHYETKTVKLDDACIQSQLWDTAGQERFRCITSTYYRGAMGVILVYDVTNKKTFDNLQYWSEDIRKYTSPDTDILLVGNKCDMTDTRQVRYSKAKAYADKEGMQFVETSAMGNKNVEQAFLTLLTVTKNKLDHQQEFPYVERAGPADVVLNKHKRGACC